MIQKLSKSSDIISFWSDPEWIDELRDWGANQIFTPCSRPSRAPCSSGVSAGAAICYLEGTLIPTPAGERDIEALRPGDMVLDAAGRARNGSINATQQNGPKTVRFRPRSAHTAPPILWAFWRDPSRSVLCSAWLHIKVFIVA